MAGYDDREGFIWMDGKLVEWRGANVHILTHALHYASAVFEGELESGTPLREALEGLIGVRVDLVALPPVAGPVREQLLARSMPL